MSTAAHAAPHSPRINFAVVGRITRRTRAKVAAGALGLQRQAKGIRGFVLQTSGLASISAGAWHEWGIGAGLGVVGVALFVLNFLMSDSPPDGRR